MPRIQERSRTAIQQQEAADQARRQQYDPNVAASQRFFGDMTRRYNDTMKQMEVAYKATEEQHKLQNKRASATREAFAGGEVLVEDPRTGRITKYKTGDEGTEVENPGVFAPGTDFNKGLAKDPNLKMMDMEQAAAKIEEWTNTIGAENFTPEQKNFLDEYNKRKAAETATPPAEGGTTPPPNPATAGTGTATPPADTAAPPATANPATTTTPPAAGSTVPSTQEMVKLSKDLAKNAGMNVDKSHTRTENYGSTTPTMVKNLVNDSAYADRTDVMKEEAYKQSKLSQILARAATAGSTDLAEQTNAVVESLDEPVKQMLKEVEDRNATFKADRDTRILDVSVGQTDFGSLSETKSEKYGITKADQSSIALNANQSQAPAGGDTKKPELPSQALAITDKVGAEIERFFGNAAGTMTAESMTSLAQALRDAAPNGAPLATIHNAVKNIFSPEAKAQLASSPTFKTWAQDRGFDLSRDMAAAQAAFASMSIKSMRNENAVEGEYGMKIDGGKVILTVIKDGKPVNVGPLGDGNFTKGYLGINDTFNIARSSYASGTEMENRRISPTSGQYGHNSR